MYVCEILTFYAHHTQQLQQQQMGGAGGGGGGGGSGSGFYSGGQGYDYGQQEGGGGGEEEEGGGGTGFAGVYPVGGFIDGNRFTYVQVMVPNKAVSFLIGKGGINVSTIEKQSGARLEFTKEVRVLSTHPPTHPSIHLSTMFPSMYAL